LIALSTENILRIKDSKTLEIKATITLKEEPAQLAFNQPGTHVIFSSSENGLRIVDIATGKNLLEIGEANGFLLSPSGRAILTWSEVAKATLWDEGTCRARVVLHPSAKVRSASFGDDGKVVLLELDNDEVQVWRCADGAMLKSIAGRSSGTTSAGISTIGSRIVVGAGNGDLYWWPGVEENVPRIITVSRGWPVVASYFIPDGQRLVCATSDRTIKILDAESAGVIATLPGGTLPLQASHINRGGRLLAVCRENELELYDVINARTFATLRGPVRDITFVQFDPSGRKVLAGVIDEGAYIWPIYPNDLEFISQCRSLVDRLR
jgi:WD40 repeat protein